MQQSDFDAFSKEELLELESACEAFEQDLDNGKDLGCSEYVDAGNDRLLGLVQEEFEKIRESKKNAARTHTGLPDELKTLGGDDAKWGGFAEGQLVGRFRLVRLLGRGATSQVWQAHDLQLSRDVAIKFPQANRSGVLKRFARESKAVAKLRHSNIVSIHEVNLEGETPYLVCDLVSGESLAECLDHRTFTFEESVELMVQVAEAIAYSHKQEVLHRDLKPQNILVDKSGKPYVTDFGLARILDAEEDLLTREGDLLGTPAFMSPEQARGNSSVDQRSDIYSLGVVFFQLLTGDLPFRGNIQSIVHQILSNDPLSPRIWNGRIPKDLETICLKCLAKNPKSRFQSAAELANELKRFQRNEPIVSRPVSRIEQLRKWIGRNKLVAASVGATCLLLIGLAVGGMMFGLTVSAAHQKQIRLRLAAEASEKEALISKLEKEKALEEALTQKRLAEQKVIDAENAFQFLGSIFQQSEPILSVLAGDSVAQQNPPSLEKVFRNAAQRLESRFPGDIVTQAHLLDTLGNSCRSLGLFDAANELFTLAQQAREKHRSMFDEATLATQNRHHDFFVGQLLQDTGRLREAEERMLNSLTATSESRDEKLFRASVSFQLGKLYLSTRKNADARKHFEESVAIRTEFLPHDAPSLRAARIALEFCHGVDGDMQSLYRIRKLVRGEGWPARAAQLYVAALISRELGNTRDAVNKYRELVTFLREILTETHPLFLMAMGEFAGLLWDEGDYRNALGSIEFVIEHAERMSPDHYLLKQAKLKLAQEYHRNGEHEKAIPMLEELLAQNPSAGTRYEIFHSLIWCYHATDRFAKARQTADQLLAVVNQRTHEVAAWIQFSAARVYEKSDSERAASLDAAALKAVEGRDVLPASGFWCRRVAIVLLHHHELDMAEKYVRHALQIETERFHAEHPRVANCKMTLAEILKQQDRLEEAKAEVNEALRIRKNSLPKSSRLIVECNNQLKSLEHLITN